MDDFFLLACAAERIAQRLQDFADALRDPDGACPKALFPDMEFMELQCHVDRMRCRHLGDDGEENVAVNVGAEEVARSGIQERID